MLTIKQHLESIEDEDVRERALRNVEMSEDIIICDPNGMAHKTLHDSLYAAFVFHITPKDSTTGSTSITN